MKSYYDEFARDEHNARLLAEEELLVAVTEQICELMEEKEVNRTKLSRKLGRSKGYVTQLLKGNRNLTLRTLADLGHALGCDVKLEFNERAKSVTRAAKAKRIQRQAAREPLPEPESRVTCYSPARPTIVFTGSSRPGCKYIEHHLVRSASCRTGQK